MRIDFAKGLSAVVVSIVMVGTLHAGDAVQSGLKVGESGRRVRRGRHHRPEQGQDPLLSLKVRSRSGGLRLRPQDLRALGQFGQED